MENFEPVVWWESHRIEKMQIEVQRGQFIQLAACVGTAAKPQYVVVQMTVDHAGNVELRGDVPIKPWDKEVRDEA